MIDLLIFTVLACLIHASILHLWFDSYIFDAPLSYLRRVRSSVKGLSFLWWLTLLPTCPQCLGFWVALPLVSVMSIVVPNSPVVINNWLMVLMISLAVNLASEYVIVHMPYGMIHSTAEFEHLDFKERYDAEPKMDTDGQYEDSGDQPSVEVSAAGGADDSQGDQDNA